MINSDSSAASGAPRLSAVVITKNEEAVIRRCIESISWTDEVVVMDSGSSDRTVEICRELGAQVHHADWQGPATQRNRGIEHARGEWILALDADEWVTDALRREIESVMQQSSRSMSSTAEISEYSVVSVPTAPLPSAPVAYKIPRLSSYCGRYLRHGGWWPDHVSRFFQRGSARFEGGIIHDHLRCTGPIGQLRNHLMHEPVKDLTKVLEKVNAYSTWGAQSLHQEGASVGLARAIGHGIWTFFRTYILRAGFLDGREGFMLAVSNAEGTYYKYVKLMLMAAQKRGEPGWTEGR